LALAIFDLDETLLSSDSDHEWGQFLVKKGFLDKEEHDEKARLFYDQYKLGVLDVEAYFRFSCSTLTPFSKDDLDSLLEEFVLTVMEPLILPAGRELISRHLSAGDYPIVITATVETITAPIVEALGIQTLIAPIPEIKDNDYTGDIAGIPSFAEGKVTRLMDWISGTQYNLEGSYFYSDSHNDLPLLKLVDHPIAVDPDEILASEAQNRGWKVISLR
jgi:HAD superfamily hydrolase (TIGR01490 family)